jgi:hypothetical protein
VYTETALFDLLLPDDSRSLEQKRSYVRKVIDTCEHQVAGRPEIELLSVRRRLHGDDD